MKPKGGYIPQYELFNDWLVPTPVQNADGVFTSGTYSANEVWVFKRIGLLGGYPFRGNVGQIPQRTGNRRGGFGLARW